MKSSSTMHARQRARRPQHALIALVVTLILIALGIGLSTWQFVVVVALSKGLAALGLVLLLRCGLVSFGQGLYYCAGAYAVGMAMSHLGMRDLVPLLLLATVSAAVIAALLGVLLSRYRDIFFAILTLAFTMILYGLLIRNPVLGGSDGFNVQSPTFFLLADGALSRRTMFIITAVVVGVSIWAVQRFLATPMGRLGPAMKDNEIRVEYLGASARRNIFWNYTLAGALAGLGGGLTSFSIGHIDPDLAFWTTSGEFLFIAILGGTRNAYAPFLGAIALELIRSLAFQYVPNSWQIVIGVSMLVIIIFLPGGLISIARLWLRSAVRGA
ncbi:branched-chain amino acid ABC transporter permease [Castellaniella sp.]|uniref:branched-chain amino acid ABC transporter permease n=1 Tax=Castellaniella sp. TaxID=1955812 RepID=UPI00355CFF42